ncbi:MAG: dipeptidase [Chthoniobacterales bacterium]
MAITSLKPLSSFAAGETAVSSAAADLYRDAFVLDANALVGLRFPLSESNDEALSRMIRDSGVTAVKSTLGGASGGFEEAIASIASTEELIEKRADLFLKVRVAADLDRAKTERKLGLIYSFESANMLEDKVERIELFRRLGVRVMQLTYNRRTPFGVGCLDGEADGLTELGRKAIAKMNQIGVALDLSHLNTRTTAESIAASNKPPLITHAGCRAIHMHPRNKEDGEMKALADKGGTIGIYMLPYITASPKQPMLDDYMRHLEHALKICGEDHVGIGTDVPFFPIDKSDLEEMAQEVEKRKAAGIGAPGEDRPTYIPDLNTPRKIERIADQLLRRGHKRTVVEKVLGANFKRVFGEIWTA